MPAPTDSKADDLTLRCRRVVTPDGIRPATVRICDGRIRAVDDFDASDAAPIQDVALLPGLIDPHVHLNEPGRTEWEGFATGTAAAAAGGVTTLIDMPLNSSPVTTSAEALATKREAAGQQLSSDVGFYGGLVPGSETRVGEMLDAGAIGIKAFLCDSGIDEFPAATERELRAAMPVLAVRGAPLLVHAEVVTPVANAADSRRYADYLASRPPQFERAAIELLVGLCRETGCRTHVVHLADADSLPQLRAARSEGLPITVETCPHYLSFCAEEIPDGATEYKCAPPIRDAANREALWGGIADGVIDFIASDHSPCPPAMKRREAGRFTEAWGGIASVQLTLPVIWTEASQRGHTLEDVAGWLSHNPAEFLGIEAGVYEGAPANLVVFDPDAEWTVRGAALKHRHPLTPYEGRTLRGVVRETRLRGALAEAGKGRSL